VRDTKSTTDMGGATVLKVGDTLEKSDPHFLASGGGQNIA